MPSSPRSADSPSVTRTKHGRKNGEIFESLTLAFGFFGLNWLYLGRTAPALTRGFHLASALVLLVTGASFLSLPIMAAGGGFLLVLTGLWIRDYVQRDQTLAAYHANLEQALTKSAANASPNRGTGEAADARCDLVA